MNGYIVGTKRYHLVYRIDEVRCTLSRQPGDHVCIYARKSDLTGVIKGSLYIVGRMAASYDPERFAVRRLRIYAYAVCTARLQNLELFFRYRVGSSRLNGKLREHAHIKGVMYQRDKLGKLLRCKCSRRTSAYVYALGKLTSLLSHRPR